MKHILQKSIIFIVSIIILTITDFYSFSILASEEITEQTKTANTTLSETPTFTIEKLSDNQLKLIFYNSKENSSFSKENFEVFGYYTNQYGEFKVSWDLKKIQKDSENSIILISYNELIENFNYVVVYYPLKENKKVLAKNNFIVSKEEETTMPTTTLSIALHNQEAIHIPANITFADGTPIQTVRDIAKYAFSFITSDGTIVVPTYEANATGISDIIKVEYRTNKRASAIIIEKIYLKIYFDTNQDNWVTTKEKTEDAIGYYCIGVEINKTITIEDWSIVTN